MGFFDHLFSAPPKHREYSEQDKPKTRPELFKLILHDHFFNLIPLNLIMLLVFLPTLIWVASGFAYLTQELGTDGTWLDAISLSRTWVLVMIPCLSITGPILSGAACVTRNLARDDFRFPKQAFLSALKEEWKPALCISFGSALIPLLIWAAASLYGPAIARGNLPESVLMILTLLVCLLWCMALPTLYFLLVTYRQPLREQIKLALILMLKYLPLVCGVELLVAAPVLLGVLAFFFAGSFTSPILLVLTVFYLLFGFALSELLYAFVANKQMEESINANIPGVDDHIGMRGNS